MKYIRAAIAELVDWYFRVVFDAPEHRQHLSEEDPS